MFDIVLPWRDSTAYFGKFAAALFLRKAAFFCLHLVSREFSVMAEAELKKPVDIYFAVKKTGIEHAYLVQQKRRKILRRFLMGNPFGIFF